MGRGGKGWEGMGWGGNGWDGWEGVGRGGIGFDGVGSGGVGGWRVLEQNFVGRVALACVIIN